MLLFPYTNPMQSTCGCDACGSTALRMSDATAEVPAEVEAMDGIASDEEAHNAERPARSSISKKKGGAKSGTPLADLEIGSSVEGTVKAVQAYGAFLDIGAQTDALLHVSRISDDFISNVEDVVKAGDKITVRIVSVDADKGQIAVTARSEEAEKAAADRSAGGGGRRRNRPQRSGGDREAQKKTLAALSDAGYDGDKFVEGSVASILDFGAFVRFDVSQLAEGVEGELDGLVHISALQAGRTNAVTDVVSVGDSVKVRVKNLDVAGGKVGLSMISKEDEPAPRERRERAPRNQRWSPDEMGAADWADTMKDLEQPTFVNGPVLIER